MQSYPDEPTRRSPYLCQHESGWLLITCDDTRINAGIQQHNFLPRDTIQPIDRKDFYMSWMRDAENGGPYYAVAHYCSLCHGIVHRLCSEDDVRKKIKVGEFISDKDIYERRDD